MIRRSFLALPLLVQALLVQALLVLSALPGAAQSTQLAAAGQCAVPDKIAALGEGLPVVARTLAAQHGLTVIALGSSSTFGTGASTPDAAYPHQLALALSERFPGRDITVLNKGIPGDTAAQMLERLERDVVAFAPQLVIWQTGTNDIINDVPLDAFIAQHRAGIARLKATGADVLLVETQWSPRVVGKPAHMVYIQALRALAEQMDVPLLRRFDMMAYWLGSGRMTQESMLAADRFHMCDASYRCLAQQLAGAIEQTHPGRSLQAHARPEF